VFDEYRSIRSWLVRMRRMKYLDAKDVGFGCTVGCTYSTVDAVFSLQSSMIRFPLVGRFVVRGFVHEVTYPYR
jgi:hypothetical protein